jgi:hypothetical protein
MPRLVNKVKGLSASAELALSFLSVLDKESTSDNYQQNEENQNGCGRSITTDTCIITHLNHPFVLQSVRLSYEIAYGALPRNEWAIRIY